MNKPLLCLVLAGAVFSPVLAERINQSQAQAIAEKFISSRSSTRSQNELGNLSISNYKDAIFIVNNPSAGWVLVSADDALPQPVLGYGQTGSFSIDKLSDGARWLLDEYAEGIKSAGSLCPPRQSVTRANSSVAPLLGEISWSQFSPYNDLCPEVNEEKSLAGCVNIAVAQIMAYHRYPERGMGSHYYDWNGTRLSVDFSQSEYRWDLIKPVYTGEETHEEKNAVAQLIYDLGVCNQSAFSPGETPASFQTGNFISFFDYDPGITSVIREQCKEKDYIEILRTELDAGRPVYVEGGSSVGGHSFVCDGYDEEGYFHYNFGWGGDNDGYYLCSATGFDSYPALTIGIKPNEGGLPGIWAASGEDVYWEKDNYINCYFNGVIYCGIRAIIEAGIGLQNKDTGEITYFPKIKSETPWTNIQIWGFNFDDEVADGEYILYPVCRVEGGEWKRVYIGENASEKVDVSVKDGIKTYTNSGVGGEIDPDVVLIDGIYYRFNEDEAIVTKRNSRANSYSGDVTIPDFVTYVEKSYPVTVIGEEAFKLAQLNNLTIGSNVRLIEAGAFTQCYAADLLFAEGSKLKTIASWAFNLTAIPVVRLPEGLEIIEPCAFRGGIEVLDIPASVKNLPRETFSCIDLREAYVHWKSAEEFPAYETFTISSDVRYATLFVPDGCAHIYRDHELWSRFGKIKEITEKDKVVMIDQLYYSFYDDEAIVTSPATRAESYSGNIMIPSTVTYEGTEYPVAVIGENAFRNAVLESIVIGDNVRAIDRDAFTESTISDFRFADDSKLKEIGFAAFSMCVIPKLKLPEGVETLDELAFNGAIDELDLPSSVNKIPSGSLCSYSLKDLFVHWESHDALPFYDESAIMSDVSNVTLHVPANCTDIYMTHKLWSQFGLITEDQSGIDDVNDDNDILNVTMGDGFVRFNPIDSDTKCDIYSLDGRKIVSLISGDTYYLGKGIYILKIGNKVLKITA